MDACVMAFYESNGDADGEPPTDARKRRRCVRPDDGLSVYVWMWCRPALPGPWRTLALDLVRAVSAKLRLQRA